MAVSKELKDAVLGELQKGQPLMNLELVRQELLKWLEHLPIPDNSENETWEQRLREFPAEPEDVGLESGLRIRLSLSLRTKENRYQLSILESLMPTSREVHIVCVHVNWKDTEWQLQKNVEQCYAGNFDDAPKASHTVWAQNFVLGQLGDALAACALAIFGNELINDQSQDEDKNLCNPLPVSVNFPKPSDD
ncbi:MAG: hypothetical protein KOO62_10805 [candidate division Zixibacteria bacterium]|nr:hypothetical protein [candidate division Zixibacteria bacterium]